LLVVCLPLGRPAMVAIPSVEMTRVDPVTVRRFVFRGIRWSDGR